MCSRDNFIEIHNLKRNNTRILDETQNRALQMNAILKTREEEKDSIHMLDTAVDGEPPLCINESQWAYGTKIRFCETGRQGGEKRRKESHLADQKRLGRVFLHINNYNSECCF